MAHLDDGDGAPAASGMVLKLFAACLRRELRLLARHAGDAMASVLFLAMAAALFPLAIGPAPGLLARIAPGLVWVLALLAALLPLERLYGADHEDGGLDELRAAGLPPAAIALAKMIAHWLGTGLTLWLAAIPVGLALGSPPTPAGLLALLLGTLSLSLVGGVAASAALGARSGGVLLPLLTLPLVGPPLIFGSAATLRAAAGQPAGPALALLGAFTCAAAAICPLAAGVGLRNAGGE